MDLNSILETAGKIVGLLGGGAAVVFALSAWLGKLWAARILQAEKNEQDRQLEAFKRELSAKADAELARLKSALDVLKEKEITAHQDKIQLYRSLIKPIADFFITAVYKQAPDRFAFEAERVRLWGELAMFAPPEVITAFMGVSEYLARLLSKGMRPDWSETRKRALEVINEVRKDLRIAGGGLDLQFEDW